jgi:hypothetical protein
MKVLSCEMDVCGFARRAASVSMMEFSFVVVENGAGPEREHRAVLRREQRREFAGAVATTGVTSHHGLDSLGRAPGRTSKALLRCWRCDASE